MPNTIGDWTEQQLIRFIENKIKPTTATQSLTADQLVAVKKFTCMDQLQIMQTQATVGAAGTASALPANPAGYFKVYDNTGVVVVIPYYKSS